MIVTGVVGGALRGPIEKFAAKHDNHVQEAENLREQVRVGVQRREQTARFWRDSMGQLDRIEVSMTETSPGESYGQFLQRVTAQLRSSSDAIAAMPSDGVDTDLVNLVRSQVRDLVDLLAVIESSKHMLNESVLTTPAETALNNGWQLLSQAEPKKDHERQLVNRFISLARRLDSHSTERVRMQGRLSERYKGVVFQLSLD